MSDTDAIRERHKPRDIGNECAWCHLESWPCDTRVVLDALDAARADADRLHGALRDLMLALGNVESHSLELAQAERWARKVMFRHEEQGE